MYVYNVYIEQNMCNSMKIGPNCCIIPFHQKDMPIFNELLTKNDLI